MNEEMKKGRVPTVTVPEITPETKMIDVISRYRQTESTFRRLNEEVGTCVCCQGLFLSLREAAERFGFNLEILMNELHAEIQGGIQTTRSEADRQK